MYEQIRSVSASKALLRSGSTVEVEVAYEVFGPSELRIEAVTRGFRSECEPMALRAGIHRCYAPVRIVREPGVRTNTCLLRVTIGGATSSLSVSVMRRPTTFGGLPAVG